MLFRRLALAGAMGILATAAAAQDLRPPRELPPSGFTGQQYTDSRGCVFLKAGLAGQTNWVPRVGRDRRQLCGYPPTFTPATDVAEAETAPAPAAAPAPARAASPAPAAPVAAAPAPRAAPKAQPAPETRQAGTAGCPARAPFGQKVQRADGTTALFCAGSAARLATAVAEARAPAPVTARAAAAPAQAPVVPPVTPGISPDVRIVCPAAAPNPRRVTLVDGSSTILCAGPDGDVQTAAAGLRRNGLTFAPIVPPGYRFAWEDDRLNPRRGQGTVAGQVAQDQVWTRDVPARQVTAPARATAVAAGKSSRPVVTVSAANGGQATAAGARILVQVGSFAVPANATAAKGRLSALGLPVTGGRATIGGKPVQVVYAGPFATQGEARQAVAAVRGAGFADAFIR